MGESRPVTPDTLRKTMSSKPGTSLNADVVRGGINYRF